MDYTETHNENRLLQIYSHFDSVNRLLCALVLSKTSFSYQFPHIKNQLLSQVLSFLSALIFSEIVHFIAKMTFKPDFMIKKNMTTADWIDTHIGPKHNFDLVNEEVYRTRYRFELSIRTFFYSIIVSLLLMAYLVTIYNNGVRNFTVIPRLEYSLRIPLLLATYLFFMLMMFFSLQHSIWTIKQNIPFDQKYAVKTISAALVFLGLVLFLSFCNNATIYHIGEVLDAIGGIIVSYS